MIGASIEVFVSGVVDHFFVEAVRSVGLSCDTTITLTMHDSIHDMVDIPELFTNSLAEL